MFSENRTVIVLSSRPPLGGGPCSRFRAAGAPAPGPRVAVLDVEDAAREAFLRDVRRPSAARPWRWDPPASGGASTRRRMVGRARRSASHETSDGGPGKARRGLALHDDDATSGLRSLEPDDGNALWLGPARSDAGRNSRLPAARKFRQAPADAPGCADRRGGRDAAEAGTAGALATGEPRAATRTAAERWLRPRRPVGPKTPRPRGRPDPRQTARRIPRGRSPRRAAARTQPLM
jgi:hypothetical protein